MALNLTSTATLCQIPSSSSSSSSSSISSQFPIPKPKRPFAFKTFAQSQDAQTGVTDRPDLSGASVSSTRNQLDLLEQLTSTSPSQSGYESDGISGKLTIREQLAKLVGDRDDDFSIPLGKNLKKFTPKFLTISQKRNIRRQAYLDEVSQRNDSVFFATIGAFVILPPVIILGSAIVTGYVKLDNLF